MSRPGEAGGQAFRWTGAGTEGLGWFSTNGTNPPDSTATDISFLYGDVIVGFSTGGSLPVGAFRYTATTGMVELGALPGAVESRAWGVSQTGLQVVGDCTFPDGHHEAFLWDRWQGMMSLRQVLLACGADIPPGWTLDEASAYPSAAPIIVNGHDATGAPAAIAARPRLCYANCDLSTVTPRLSISDFACFINRFAAGEDYANCDHSTTPPVLNVLDFMCFIDKYVAGCSGI
jgi:probable HAF family extracellular repeat protein